jgi:hypothetical protein
VASFVTSRLLVRWVVPVVAISAAAAIALAGCSADADRSSTDGQATNSSVRVAIPDIVGLSTAEARAKLADGSLKTRITLVNDRTCAGLPSAGNVVRQLPKPGGRLPPGSTVQVQPGCAPDSKLEVCPQDELSFRAAAGEGGYTGGGNHVDFYLDHRQGPPCKLEGTLQVVVEPPAGQALTAIEGNPIVLDVDEVLSVGASFYGQWRWGNWCGPTERAVIIASLAGMTDRQASPPPVCNSPNKPSYLSDAAIVKAGSRGAYERALTATESH